MDDKTIRHVQQDDDLSSDLVSQPTKELERRLKLLENALSHLSRQGSVTNVLIKDKTIHSNVDLYNTVYYNHTSGMYEQSLAKVEFTGSQFNTLSSSMVAGIVVKKVGTTADILVDGAWPVAAMLASNNLLEPGEEFLPGKPYYLSSSHYGRITSHPPSLAVQVAVMSDTDVLMNKVYGSPDGFESSARFEMGMRPVGGIYITGNKHRIVGFHALECEDPGILDEWDTTRNSTNFSTSGYMVAEGTALSYMADALWVDISVNTSGEITVGVASTLEDLENPDISETTYSSTVDNSDTPFAIDADPFSNHTSIRNVTIVDDNSEEVYEISFKFVTNSGTFDVSKHRSVIFEIPNSFQGWKEMEPLDSKYQIRPYYSETLDSDYPDYEYVPDSDIAPLYYDTKSDFRFNKNWPPEPLDKAIVMMNGVELLSSKIVESDTVSFEDDLFNLGVSNKTVYWGTSFSSTQPWDATYEQLFEGEDGTHNSNAEIVHRPASGTKAWYWNEDLYVFEPHLNRGWVYSNKLNIYNKSSRVLGVGVLPPLKVKDSITGITPDYDGEPMTGNLLIWSDEKDTIVSKTNGVSLGQLGTHALYTNTSKFNILVREIIFIVTSQNSSQLSNAVLGVEYFSDDSALVNIGTGLEGASAENIVSRRLTNVYDYGTYAVMTINDGAKIVPPNGVVRLTVHQRFPVEQGVSIVLTGRTI